MTCSLYHIFTKKISITSYPKWRVAETSSVASFTDHLVSKKTLSLLSKQVGSGGIACIQECLF
jgi:hypothetical protein